MKRVGCVFPLLAACMLLGAGPSVGGDETAFRKGFAHVAQRATPAVVFIQVEKQVEVGHPGQMFYNNPYDLFGDEFFERFFGRRFQRPQQLPPQGGQRRGFVQTGQGSGFIITKDGYILTNTHVVGDADRIRVKLQSGKEYTARRVGADVRTEVAVIKIDAEDLPTVKLGDASKLETGEWVVAIGNPFGLKETLTVGVVSAKGRAGIGITDYEDFIQTDAAINPGNSGGPLLNIDGEVVGINTAIFSRSGGYMGIGFAVPIDLAVGIKDQLVKDGKVTRGYLGVLLNPGDLDDEMARSFGLKSGGGVLLADVVQDGPAGKAGLKAGDIVLELQGEPVSETRVFRQAVARLRPGSKVELSVFREGKTMAFTVTVGTAPDDEEGGGNGPSEGDSEAAFAEKFGLTLQALTPDLARQFGHDRSDGVLIAGVEPGSPASREGLQPGDIIEGVNRKPVASPAEFHRLAAVEKGPVLLQIRTARGRRFVLLRAEE